MQFKASYLAKIVGGEVAGKDIEVSGISGVNDARASYVTWAEDEKNFILAEAGPACCIIVSDRMNSSSKTLIKVKSPRIAFAKIMALFAPEIELCGIHTAAFIDGSAKLGKNVAIGANAVISKNVVMGNNVKIFPLVYIGENVNIGDNTIVYPGAAILSGAVLGKNVVVHSGAIIGADGFGFVKDGEKNLKIPQLGSVKVEDDVEIGANSCIDRGTTGTTIIGRGTKIDNFVQVAHNVEIGKHCILAALSGVAGSSRLGNGVTLAAQVGVTDHVKIGDDSIVMGRAGVTKDIPSGSMVSGFPAKPHKEHMKIEAVSSLLPKIAKTISGLKNKIEDLEKRVQEFEER